MPGWVAQVIFCLGVEGARDFFAGFGTKKVPILVHILPSHFGAATCILGAFLMVFGPFWGIPPIFFSARCAWVVSRGGGGPPGPPLIWRGGS